jgi:ABC-2 type transport system ATP-binding protein
VSWLAPEGRRSVQTDTPTRVVAELAGRFSGEVPELTVTRPSLEDIYLSMIGHAEDGAAGGLPGRSLATTGATQ